MRLSDVALESWPKTGIPDNPRPWLISTARFKAIDGMSRRAEFPTPVLRMKRRLPWRVRNRSAVFS